MGQRRALPAKTTLNQPASAYPPADQTRDRAPLSLAHSAHLQNHELNKQFLFYVTVFQDGLLHSQHGLIQGKYCCRSSRVQGQKPCLAGLHIPSAQGYSAQTCGMSARMGSFCKRANHHRSGSDCCWPPQLKSSLLAAGILGAPSNYVPGTPTPQAGVGS